MIESNQIGLAGSDAFFQYIKALRKTASFGSEYGSRTGTTNSEHTIMPTSSDSYDESNSNIDRKHSPNSHDEIRWRTFMLACGATLATAAGAGPAAARSRSPTHR